LDDNINLSSGVAKRFRAELDTLKKDSMMFRNEYKGQMSQLINNLERLMNINAGTYNSTLSLF